MKRSKKKNQEYFNLDIETQTDVKNVVCFSPSKRALFAEAAETRTGCEIKNAKRNPGNTYFISDYSTVKSLELGFPCTNQYRIHSIVEVINEVALESKVNVSGVLVLNDTRHIMVNGQEVPIREGFVIDDTGSIKITLWREYTQLQNNVTYDFLQLIKKKHGSDVILQSIHSTTYNVSGTQIEDYQVPEISEPLVIVDTTLVGVESKTANYCPICKAVVHLPEEKQIFRCEKCSNQILLANVVKNLLRKVTIQADALVTLNLPETVLEEAFAPRNLRSMDDSQISLLLLTSTFDIRYDTHDITSLTLQ